MQQEVESLRDQNSTVAATNQQLEMQLQEAQREVEQQRSLVDKLRRLSLIHISEPTRLA